MMHIKRFLPITLACLPTSYAQLHKLSKANGKYFGSATDNYELNDAPYKAILSDGDEFGQTTPGNLQKWYFSEPQQGVFDFSGGDQLADYAESEGMILRCHTLVWHSQLAPWVEHTQWTNETLIAAMKNHIKGMTTHFQRRCAHWDVVNEAFEEDGSYRKSIGPEFIPIAFATAAEYDPEVKLYYNDYNLEYNGEKTEATRQLVRSLKARNIKIDGVGYQGHLIVGSTPGESSLTANLNAMTALGVEVAYTELDVRHPSLPPTTAALVRQDQDYTSVVKSCLNVAKCVGITIWDYTDKYSWIPGVFAGQGDALLWDNNLQKKQVYYAVVKALGGTITSTASSSLPSTSSTSSTSPTALLTTTPAVSSSSILTTASPIVFPTSIVATTTSSRAPTPTFLKCSRDNCLRNLLDARYSVSVAAFCSGYTTAMVTAATAIPTYLGGCAGLPSRVSSACACAATKA